MILWWYFLETNFSKQIIELRILFFSNIHLLIIHILLMYFMLLLFYYLKQRIFRNLIDTIMILIIEVKCSNEFLFEKFFDSSGRISVKKKNISEKKKERKKD